MKKIFLSLLFVGAFGLIASAQNNKNNGANAHGKMVSSTAHKSTATTTSTTTTNATEQTGNGSMNNSGMTTTQKHKGWKKGKHKGWTKKHTSKTTTTTTKM